MFTHPPNIFVQPWSERYHHMVYAPIVWGDRFLLSYLHGCGLAVAVSSLSNIAAVW